MTPSKILFFLCLSLVIGVFIESLIEIPQIFIWGFLILGVVMIIFSLTKSIFFSSQPVFPGPFASKKIIWLAQNLLPRVFFFRVSLITGFCFLVFVLGVLRMQGAEFKVESNKLAQLNGQEVVLQGFVADEPVIKEKSLQIKIKTGKDTVLVTVGRYPEYQYLDKVKITGKLETPFITEEFSYKNYLAKDGIYSVMAFPKISAQGGPASGGESEMKITLWQRIYSKILILKNKLSESINKNYPAPESSVLQGMLLGKRAVIPQEINEQFKITGTSHIIAVSGTHIIILATIFMALLICMGLWRQQAFYFTAVFVCFYIVLVGLPASGVRAGIMAILFLGAQNLGRQANSARIIVLAATLMLVQNPMLLVYDIGFQLSFLAVLGLIYFEPLVRELFKFFVKKIIKKELPESSDNKIMFFSATISAQIFTLPIIVYNFGNISFISPLANILILPVVYYLMLFGFISALAGVLLPWLGWVLALLCHIVMSYFIYIVDLLSKPWAYKVLENMHWSWLFVLYIILSFGVWFLNKRFRVDYL